MQRLPVKKPSIYFCLCFNSFVMYVCSIVGLLEPGMQGDQIGRIFAPWANVFFGIF
jgi:hypothetical protein